MKVLLTGANGFVGIEAARQLVEGGHQVLAADSLRYCPWRIEDLASGNLQLLQIDLRNHEETVQMVRDFDPDAIIHLAAIHFIPECERLPHDAISINIEATVNLLSACPKSCRFVFASTAAVYAPSDQPHRIDGTIGPMDVYGHSKLAGEEFVQYFAEKTGFEAVVIRLFNVVGPGETNPHLLPEIISQLRNGARKLKLGNTSPKRDYVYVGDAAAGFIAAALTPMPEGKTIITANLGTGSEYSVLEMVERIGRIIGEDITIETDPGKVRKSDRPHLCADNSQMQSAFGWVPKYDIEMSLKDTWENPLMIERLLDPRGIEA